MGVNTAMSLNEIVNAPAEFVSRNPHFVVDKLDWIQTRYLFVQCVVKPEAVSSQPITNPVPQDPLVTPSGESGKSIVLPWSAVPRANRPSASKELAMIGVETRSLSGPFNNVKVAPEADIDIDDTLSIATLDEDLELFRLISDTEDDYVNGGDSAIDLRQSYVPTPEELETDFVPGALDHSTLPRLPPPEDASPMASKQLLQRFNALIKVQDSKAPAALGWYIDPQQFGNNPNFFQWIIELHSFDQTTLLAKDMKQVDITSIVLEFRFPKDFPYAPPFVRVVRPRLLPFNSGGGGHVTLGGSLCMQLLTNDGWLATMDIEGVLVSIRHEIMDPDPRPARLETHRHQQDYGIGEAVEGYIRACATHGWRVPVGFKESMMMMEQPPVAAGALW
jgi:ubiquitin-conjugating enzyme E2 Q